jgi:hypothetical protein
MLNKFSALKHTGALFGNVNSAELRSAWCPGYLIQLGGRIQSICRRLG